VVRCNRDAAPEAMTRIARALGAPDAIAGVFTLAGATGAPSGLARLGLAYEAIGDVVRAVLAAAPPNPRPLDERSLYNLLLEALEDGPMPTHEPEKSPAAGGRADDATRPTGGFGGAMESEALAGALPRRQNAPRKSPYGLYPELVSGVPFTTRRAENTRLWLYKIRPSTLHGELVRLPEGRFTGTFGVLDPNRIRWRPLPIPQEKIDFLDGMHTLGGLGDPAGGPGYAVHLYAASADMGDRCLTNSDGDMLIVPQEGTLVARTECGVLRVAPGEVLLVPRGLKLTIDLPDGRGRGYVGEVFGVRFRLPERGPIGSNGLADARHFVAPSAAYEDRAVKGYRLVTKIGGALWAGTQDFSPYDVVAWHGNHVPYKYDLMLFNAMGSTTFDHPDPSIHTVLTAPLDDHGRAVCDFVCFRGRWDVIEHSLRPPFFHRNAATEVNGIVRAASVDSGYEPGGCFVTPLLTGHGVTTRAYEAALALTDDAADAPRRLPDASLWIMFESALPFRLTRWAQETDQRDSDFAKLFDGTKSHFDPTRR
jgi:homogentisate 1,2-dioxygenase